MPKTAIVTGSGGLIGSESARHLAESGFRVIGLDNDMRSTFFGETASDAQMKAMVAKVEQNEKHPWHKLLGNLTSDAFRPQP